MYITIGEGLLDQLKEENYLLTKLPTITEILNCLENLDNEIVFN